MFSLTEVPPQSEKELWLASLTEGPPSIRKRTLARFAHRSPPQSEEELWLASLTEVISSSEQPAIP